MEAITGAVTSVVTLAESLLTSIMANSTLMIIMGAGFASLGLRVLRRVIKTTHTVG